MRINISLGNDVIRRLDIVAERTGLTRSGMIAMLVSTVKVDEAKRATEKPKVSMYPKTCPKHGGHWFSCRCGPEEYYELAK